jgi:hypothetical protein
MSTYREQCVDFDTPEGDLKLFNVQKDMLNLSLQNGKEPT